MENKQHALQDIDRQSESLLKLRKTVESLPDSLPGPIYVHTSPDYISTHILFDIRALRTTRRLLGSSWKFNYVHTDDAGNRYFEYLNKENVELSVIQVGLGETCQRVKVGEKTVPVYKVVCSPAQ